MKKIFVLCFLVLSMSCSVDNDATEFNLEVLPIDSVDIPTEFTLGETYPITVSYLRPSTCHSFKNFYYYKENNQRTVAPITYVFKANNCEIIENVLVEATFNFNVTSNGSYIFKFWQGEDENGDPIYLTIEVPVIE
ncbi:MAG: hypothetical protein NWQ07_07900 [Flaviramulus sp.]|nr:hypothetical protein [Flaviramulus sp.]